VLDGHLITVLVELLGDLHDPVLVFQAGAGRMTRIDALTGTDGPAIISQLIQDDLAGTSRDSNRFDDTVVPRRWRIALPRRREKFSRWYLDTVVDNGRAATSARKRASSLDSVSLAGSGSESSGRFI